MILLTRSIFIHLLQVPCTFSSAAVMDKIAFSSFACIFSKPNTILYAYLDTVAIKVKGVSGYKEEMSHSANNQKMDFLVHFSHLSLICIRKNSRFLCSLYLQCESLAIFLPLWFYVKSILAYFRRSKIAIWKNLEALIFHFWEFHTWKCSKLLTKSLLRSPKMVKMAIFDLL